jgi:hypothetical protein
LLKGWGLLFQRLEIFHFLAGVIAAHLTVGEFIARSSGAQFGNLNHGHPAEPNALVPAPGAGCFRGEADINQQTNRAKSVENDPKRTFAPSILL